MAHLAKICIFFTRFSIYTSSACALSDIILYTGELRVELFLVTVATFKTPVRTKHTIFFMVPSEICLIVEISVIVIE